uniref:Uncharacterized protein n=1 Tax=Aegilops tauschii subsp. strangulata TaxID=200361 RepID=A0A453QR05_AEGTS
MVGICRARMQGLLPVHVPQRAGVRRHEAGAALRRRPRRVRRHVPGSAHLPPGAAPRRRASPSSRRPTVTTGVAGPGHAAAREFQERPQGGDRRPAAAAALLPWRRHHSLLVCLRRGRSSGLLPGGERRPAAPAGRGLLRPGDFLLAGRNDVGRAGLLRALHARGARVAGARRGRVGGDRLGPGRLRLLDVPAPARPGRAPAVPVRPNVRPPFLPWPTRRRVNQSRRDYVKNSRIIQVSVCIINPSSPSENI